MVATEYDVFLSHNSDDKPAVLRIAQRLQQERLEPWLDAWHLTAGGAWIAELEAGLAASRSCAVFVGPHGVGDWERMELEVALDRAAKDRGFRLFLVLLPGVPEPFDPTTLPAFLKTRSWVDLRDGFAATGQLQPLIRAIAGRSAGPDVPSESRDGASPYLGLLAFDEEHAEFFFGRDADTQRLLEKLKASRFLAVVGPSGSGKSSLARAGLIPALRTNGLPGSSTWPVRVFRPGGRPLQELAAQLVRLDSGRTMGATLDELRADPRALDLAATLALDGKPAEERVVLLVDQFEELFTLCHDEEERERFLATLIYAATVPNGRCVVVLTLRADFYPRCAAYPELAALLASHQFLVGPLDEPGLHDAIVLPAEKLGVSFEPGLVETILDDVRAQPGALPLLEHALLELWQRHRGNELTLDDYRKSGGVAGAIAQRAEAEFADLSAEEQAVARRVLLRLTQPGEETEDTRRRAGLNELVTRPEERPVVERVVNALVAARLLTTSHEEPTGEAQVDVAHEALIRAWGKLRDWVEEDRQGLIVHGRLTQAAQEWERAEHDPDLLYRGARLAEAQAFAARQPDALNELERQFLQDSAALRERELAAAEAARLSRERLRRRAMAGLTAFAVVALVLAGFAGWQWREAQGQRDVAVTAVAEARHQTDVAVNAQAAQATEAALARSAEAEAEAEAAARATAEIAANAAAATAEAEAARAENEAARAENEARVALSRQLAAQSRTLADDLDLGLLLAAEAYDLNPNDLEVRRSLLTATTGQPQLVRLLAGHDGALRALRFSPDGQTIASGGDDGLIRFWNPQTGMEADAPLVTGQASVWDLVFSPDGKQIAATFDVVQTWDLGTGAAGPTISSQHGSIIYLAYSPDGERLATATNDAVIELWDAQTGEALGPPLLGHTGQIHSLAFSLDNSLLASADADDGTVWFWDMAAAEGGRAPGVPLATEHGGVHQVLFSPDGSIFATAGNDATIRLWDVASRLPIGEPLTGHAVVVYALAFSPDGSELFSAGEDGTIRKWQVATRRPLGEPIIAGQGVIISLAVSPDGSWLASGGSDGSLRLWNVAAEQSLFTSRGGHLASASAIAFSPTDATIATADNAGVIRLWNSAEGILSSAPLRGHSDVVWGLAFSPDGNLLASASEDGTVRLWDVATGEPRGGPLLGHAGAVLTVAFRPTGEMLVSGGFDGTVRLWRTSDGMPIGDPLGPMDPMDQIVSVSFNPEGTVLAAAITAGDGSGAITLWDPDLREPILERSIDTEQGGVFAVCFARDGTELASAGEDGTIRYWDASNGQPVGEPVFAHAGGVIRLACSADGSRLVSSGSNGRVLLWSMSGASLDAELLAANDAGFQEVAFSPDGSQVAFTSEVDVGVEQSFVTLWDVDDNSPHIAFPISPIINDAVLSADGSRVAAVGEDGRVTVWDAVNGTQLAEQRTPDDEGVWSVAFSPDGSRIALGGVAGSVHLWDGDGAKPVNAPLGHHADWVLALALSGDGTVLASGGNDGTVRLWNTARKQASGDFVFTDAIADQTTSVRTLAFREDGSLLAVAGSRTIRLWDVAQQALTGEPLQGDSGDIFNLAFSPNGRFLVSGSDAGVVRLWNISSEAPTAERLADLPDAVSALVFSPDGSRLAAGTAGGAIVVWEIDAGSGSSLGQVGLVDGGVASLAFAADGNWLTSLDATGGISRWDLSEARWRERACQMANRNLSRDEWGQYIGDPESPTLPYHATCPDLPLPVESSAATPVAAAAEGALPATPAVPATTI